MSGAFDKRLESLRVEQSTCEEDLRAREAAIDTLEGGTRVLRQRAEACEATCRSRGHPCTLLRGQVDSL